MTENAVVIKASEVEVGDEIFSYGAGKFLEVRRITEEYGQRCFWNNSDKCLDLIDCTYFDSTVFVKCEIDVDAAVKRWAAKRLGIRAEEITSAEISIPSYDFAEIIVSYTSNTQGFSPSINVDGLQLADLIKEVMSREQSK